MRDGLKVIAVVQGNFETPRSPERRLWRHTNEIAAPNLSIDRREFSHTGMKNSVPLIVGLPADYRRPDDENCTSKFKKSPRTVFDPNRILLI